MSLLLPNNPQSKLVSTKIASDISGYNSDYLARLCREEKIIGVNVGRAWIIDRESLEAFTAQQLEKKQIRAKELRAARGREYRIAQKPIAKAAQIATAAREALAGSTASAAPTGTHQATPSPLSTPANVRAFSPTPPRVSSVGYSRPLAATAVALIVVAGSAYASTNPFALRAVALIPSAALALSNTASPTLLTASSFRVTDERALATTNENPQVNSFVFALPNARASLAAFTDTTGTSASAVESYVHALGDNARAPFARTEVGMVAASRIAHLSNIAANPIGSLVNGYVYSGIYAYRASVAVRDGYVDGINESGDSALTVAAHVRDTLAFAPRISNGILDTYARGIFAWNDAAPKAAGTVVAAVYDVGDVSGALALSAPARVRVLKDTLAMRAVDTSLALTDTVIEAEVTALRPLAPSSLARTQVEATDVSLGLLGKTAVRFNSLYAGFNETGTRIASAPLRAEGVLLGVAGYAGSVLDGTDSSGFEATPDVSRDVLTATAATGESDASSTTGEAASIDASRAAATENAPYVAAAPAAAESLSASVVSFAPVSWHRAFERILHASSVLALDLARTGMRAVANLLPGGIVAQPVLTIVDTGNETFLPLLPSDALTRTTRGNGNTSSNNSIVQNIFNSYFPQTILGGGASDELILAIVRPFVNASIESALRDNNRNDNDDDDNDDDNGSGGVSSDGATLDRKSVV